MVSWKNRFFFQNEVSVRIAKQGFEPNNIRINVGASVRFSSKIERPFWPASDAHPSHRLYPEFDAEKAIASGESFSFRFDKPGMWNYHDHLNPKHTGVITVTSGLFASSDCGNSNTISCWQQGLRKAYRTGGITAAFTKYKQLYDEKPDFAAACHDMAHIIGFEAWKGYRQGSLTIPFEEAASCSYGFYHGFFEAILAGGDGDLFKAKSVCDEISRQPAMKDNANAFLLACSHGLGHVSFDLVDSSRYFGNDERIMTEALAHCDAVVPEDPSRRMCANGVFYSLQQAYNDKKYGISIDTANPYRLCEKLTGSFRLACFGQMTIASLDKLAIASLEAFPSALRLVLTIPDSSGQLEAMSYIAANAGASIKKDQDLQGIISNCQILNGTIRESCLRGFIGGLFYVGKPTVEYERVLTLCKSDILTSSDKNVCYERLLSYTTMVYSPQKKKEICSRVVPIYHGEFCE